MLFSAHPNIHYRTDLFMDSTQTGEDKILARVLQLEFLIFIDNLDYLPCTKLPRSISVTEDVPKPLVT